MGIWVIGIFLFVLSCYINILIPSPSHPRHWNTIFISCWIHTFSLLFHWCLCVITPSKYWSFLFCVGFWCSQFLLIVCFQVFLVHFVLLLLLLLGVSGYLRVFALWIRTLSIVFSNSWKAVHKNYWFLYPPTLLNFSPGVMIKWWVRGRAGIQGLTRILAKSVVFPCA